MNNYGLVLQRLKDRSAGVPSEDLRKLIHIQTVLQQENHEMKDVVVAQRSDLARQAFYLQELQDLLRPLLEQAAPTAADHESLWSRWTQFSDSLVHQPPRMDESGEPKPHEEPAKVVQRDTNPAEQEAERTHEVQEIRVMSLHRHEVVDLAATSSHGMSFGKDGVAVAWPLDGRLDDANAELPFWYDESYHGEYRVARAFRSRVLAGGSDGVVRVLDPSTRQSASLVGGMGAPVEQLAWLGDALHAVSASTNGTLRVWDIAVGRVLQVAMPRNVSESAVAPLLATHPLSSVSFLKASRSGPIVVQDLRGPASTKVVVRLEPGWLATALGTLGVDSGLPMMLVATTAGILWYDFRYATTAMPAAASGYVRALSLAAIRGGAVPMAVGCADDRPCRWSSSTQWERITVRGDSPVTTCCSWMDPLHSLISMGFSNGDVKIVQMD